MWLQRAYKGLIGQGWCSGESAHLPPMWPGLESWLPRHMWVEFVVGSLPCSERFFSEYSGFPLSLKTNTSKFQFDLNARTCFNEFLWTPLCSMGKQITIYNFFNFFFTFTNIWLWCKDFKKIYTNTKKKSLSKISGLFLQHRTKWHRGLLMFSFYNPAISFLLHLYKTFRY